MRRGFIDAPADLRHDAVDDLQQMVVVAELDVGLFQLAAAFDVAPCSGPLTRISLMVGSLSSISSGPKPNVSSSTSSMRRSRSMRLSSGFSVSHRRSTTRRISRRRVSPARSLTRDRSSLSTSLPWIRRLSSSKLFAGIAIGAGLPHQAMARVPLALSVGPGRPTCKRMHQLKPRCRPLASIAVL